MKITVSMTEEQHVVMKSHLFNGDGKEAGLFLLCGKNKSAERCKLLVQQIILVPYEVCSERSDVKLSWPLKFALPHIQKAIDKGLIFIKVHSHPNGLAEFSIQDDIADKALFEFIHGWSDSNLPHASIIMLPDGKLFGKATHNNGRTQALNSIWVIGDKLKVWKNAPVISPSEYFIRNHQAFGQETYDIMADLNIAVVGCSGTGSVIIEQLVRHGVGHLILVDPEDVDDKNLNRIVNAKVSDIGKSKVEVLKAAIKEIGLGTAVTALKSNLSNKEAIRTLADADVVFGCVDSIDGRHLLNKIATYYMLPYFDLGVKIVADGKGGVEQVSSSVHYLRPGKSTLMTRNVYDSEDLRTAALKNSDPELYQQLLAEKYIKNARVERPAVISLNMNTASYAVLDLLSRLQGFRNSPDECARINISHSASIYSLTPEEDFSVDKNLSRFVGFGDVTPALGLPILEMEKV